jgi:hypothetical protein
VSRQFVVQLAALAALVAFVGWWSWEMIEGGDWVGLLAPVGFTAVVLKFWKPWRTLRGT